MIYDLLGLIYERQKVKQRRAKELCGKEQKRKIILFLCTNYPDLLNN